MKGYLSLSGHEKGISYQEREDQVAVATKTINWIRCNPQAIIYICNRVGNRTVTCDTPATNWCGLEDIVHYNFDWVSRQTFLFNGIS